MTGELTRLLINHPDVDLRAIVNQTLSGTPVTDVHQGLVGETDLRFTSDTDFSTLDLVFLACQRGESKKFLESNELPDDIKIIDLSPDFRLPSTDGADKEFVYGIPEHNRKPMVRGAKRASCPGCFATAVSLALFPLAKNGKLGGPIHIAAVEGATDAGADPSPIGHYPWRNENIAVYRPLRHSATEEIRHFLSQIQPGFNDEILFVPIRGSFSRGALVAIYLPSELSANEARALFEEAYSDHAFTFVIDRQPDLKDVVNTNKCLICIDKVDGRLMITAALDNLLKGGAGNAVHLMNLLFGLSERTGLGLKSSAY